MSLSEVRTRFEDYGKKLAWLPSQVGPGAEEGSPSNRWRSHKSPALRVPANSLRFEPKLGEGVAAGVPPRAHESVIAAADRILAGEWTLLGIARPDIEEPDWFFDPVSGKTAPSTRYCFKIDYRSPDITGNVKHVWELSRMQHVTVLAAAFALSGEKRYAERAAQHLRSWWAKNPFLSGVHWTSGIELGLRLIAWTWVRRLLDDWAEAPELFERNSNALTQIWWHQRYLDRFRSRGSSANNHVIAEAAGQLVASLAFDWFEESERWAARAAALLEDELAKNTFPIGVNREMAYEYHGFVAELGLLAAIEADRAGRPLSTDSWEVLGRMIDVVAATCDVRLQPPRHGDGDDGRGLVLGPVDANRWESLLALGGTLFGALDWWPRYEPDASSILIASLAGDHSNFARARHRPSHFADAGLTILRTASKAEPEIWCRCDAGPHGFLSIAAHAHADALSVEVRHDGVEILADPGTYCYQGEPGFRSYFRSTLGHNTIEVAHRDQSTSGGPTMWTRHAKSRLLELDMDGPGDVSLWCAEHDGYSALDPPANHRRTVRLLGQARRIDILDVVETAGPHPVRLAFHFGPEITVGMTSDQVLELNWMNRDDQRTIATLCLPKGPEWSLWRGATDPVLGWYSARFGEKQPSTSIVGEIGISGRTSFATGLQFYC
jgi:Heparinase II/III-like protein/Heparinase II/III N-terminus